MYNIEIGPDALRELDKLDPQVARRVLKFLHERVRPLEDPRSIGAALAGSRRVLEVPCWGLSDYC